MCISRDEMNRTMETRQEWKRIKEEAEDNMAALDRMIIEYLEETEACGATDKKGKPIRRFDGNLFKATYSWGSRETIVKDEVKKLLSPADYEKVKKVNSYPVLRIS